MGFNFRQSGYIGVLTLSGDITEKEKNTLSSLLMKASHCSDYIVLDLFHVNKIDNASRKLLMSICNAIKRSKKSLKLIGSITETLNNENEREVTA
ncbi:MAG: hypothetical protein HY756_10640 [Nitrospirae bacterium]|nr:hypothetical protein [Nitrospirota bacterium]